MNRNIITKTLSRRKTNRTAKTIPNLVEFCLKNPSCPFVVQELAVEDMRHELDDEGRREFFEEQGDEGDGSRGGGDRYGWLTAPMDRQLYLCGRIEKLLTVVVILLDVYKEYIFVS